MPYCLKCNYWSRLHSATPETVCPNCGVENDPVPVPQKDFDPFVTDLCGLVIFGAGLRLAMENIFAGVMMLGSGVALVLAGRLKQRALNQQKIRSVGEFPEAIFRKMREVRKSLKAHAEEIHTVLKKEQDEPHSERVEQRIELLRGALVNREATRSGVSE
jgi:hypothetical protein